MQPVVGLLVRLTRLEANSFDLSSAVGSFASFPSTDTQEFADTQPARVKHKCVRQNDHMRTRYCSTAPSEFSKLMKQRADGY
jgi:hypothetical protein